ncbi:MAG: sigma 54-interacting transcriptional regulator [Desulfovibrio sp.]|jgi:transcriptional regulator with PAS, ATPase and Fis domain|nr:sigma 54-interacting transcriptional regulator [Desulfovibrio sp.]
MSELRNILPDITRFCTIISTVTGVDIEIVDTAMKRVAGTGIYASHVGESLQQAGNIYRHALHTGSTVYVDNPRENALCLNCPQRDDCREFLTLCTPVTLNNRTMGVIGLICFNEKDKQRVLGQKDIFIEFVQQIAGIIGISLANDQRSRKVNQMLDLLLQVTDRNTHGILMISKKGKISYSNEMARSEFSLTEQSLDADVDICDTGNTVADMKEYEVRVEGRRQYCFGRHIPLDSQDDDFTAVLLIDPLPRLTCMLSQFGASAENADALQDIVGESRAIKNIKNRVLRIAKTSSTVLITGESGTGKEMFARAIHANSDRKGKPFIAINCGAIPDTLLESEFFGYVSGAFTGAHRSGRIGKFELADNGVLFLDEIGAMPLYLQVKLLRVLQERSFTRLGSNRQISVDVRIIAATNENLNSLIEQKTFRDDLYYRLNVIPLELPPLRRHKEDIPMLAEYFLDRYCRRFARPPVRLSPPMLTMLQAYSWPGNIREFENCIEYMVNMHEGGALSPSQLPAKIHDAYVKSAVGTNGPTALPPNHAPAPREVPRPAGKPVIPLEEMEKDAVRNALALFGADAEGKKMAARALGIGISTLYRKIREL